MGLFSLIQEETHFSFMSSISVHHQTPTKDWGYAVPCPDTDAVTGLQFVVKGLRQEEERVEVSTVGVRVSRKGDGVRVAESEGRGVHSTEEMEVHSPPRSYV